MLDVVVEDLPYLPDEGAWIRLYRQGKLLWDAGDAGGVALTADGSGYRMMVDQTLIRDIALDVDIGEDWCGNCTMGRMAGTLEEIDVTVLVDGRRYRTGIIHDLGEVFGLPVDRSRTRSPRSGR